MATKLTLSSQMVCPGANGDKDKHHVTFSTSGRVTDSQNTAELLAVCICGYRFVVRLTLENCVIRLEVA